jgi:hypothetical protein
MPKETGYYQWRNVNAAFGVPNPCSVPYTRMSIAALRFHSGKNESKKTIFAHWYLLTPSTVQS